MGEERQHELVSAETRRRVKPAERERPEEAGGVDLEADLARVSWRLKSDPAALERHLLERIPAGQRLTARLVLTRVLGARRASAICERAFGPGRVLEPHAAWRAPKAQPIYRDAIGTPRTLDPEAAFDRATSGSVS